MKDLIVVGNGPGGISAAIYGKRGGLNVTVISKGESALSKADKIENYYGFENPISGTELLEEGIKQAKRLGVEFLEQEVVGLGFEDKFVVTTSEGKVKADQIVLATGSPRRTPNIEGLSKFEGSGVSYCAVCDGFFFKGKDVVVLGKGEYAKHEAEVLEPIAEKVYAVEKIKEVRGENVLEEVVLEDGEVIKASGLFIAEGTAGSGDLARKIGAEVNGNKIVVNEKMETNIPGIYAVGDCTGGLMQISKQYIKVPLLE